jgi:hypothetical protein
MFCAVLPSVCDGISKIINQENDPLNVRERELIQTMRAGGSTSVKETAHQAQLMKTGKFQLFDYGSPTLNLANHGTKEVPEIPLQQIA